MKNNMVKAYSVRLTYNCGMFKALDVIDRAIKIIDKSNLLGVTQKIDGSYLLFPNILMAENNARKLKSSGINATFVKTPCYFDKKYLNDEYQNPEKEISKDMLDEDLEYIKGVRKMASEAERKEAEKAELKRQLGDITAKFKSASTELTTKKQQMAKLTAYYEKTLEEKDSIITALEHKLSEMKDEVEHLEAVKRIVGNSENA